MFEPGRRSSKRVTGTPIKKLAEEMSKEIDAKKRSPSVVARLMGLDGMPTQQPVSRQQKKLPNKYEQGTTSIELQKNGQPKKGRSIRKSFMEQQEFKDVHEDLEASHVTNRQYSSQGAANLKLIEPEIAFIQKQFVDAKHLSSDQKVHDSKLEMLDSNNNFKASRKHGIGPLKNLEDGITRQSNSGRAAHNSSKSSTIRIAGKDERDTLPTRIVVLKPNLENTSNATKYVSSPDSSHSRHSNRFKQTEYSGDLARKAESWKVLRLTPRNYFERKHRHKLSISGSTESSVSREAKKRLSERWKMTQRYQDEGVIVKGSALGEMLSIPDTVARSENWDGMMSLDGSSDSFANNSGNAVWESPLGISSGEGWNDGSIRHPARSRLLPPLVF
ncbi:hypothetical protein RJ640_002964 [Escallonia rubra]|uniref:DUF3741 domain-containing protein n=1 Tax=Escallonia rubra TaxID=112253 RepID=A0AA88UL85_9ASTE|nr:hypothetical protein RJ640_002964 [Escallonia rubra]